MLNRPRNLSEALRRNAKASASLPALTLFTDSSIVPGGRTIRWAELEKWVVTLAAFLRAESANRPIVHRITNTAEDILVALSCQSAGIVEVPVDGDGGDRYLESCIASVNGWWLDDPTKLKAVRSAWLQSQSEDRSNSEHPDTPQPATSADPNADALVLWTSGTSGAPKGVVLSHRSLLCNAAAKLRAVPQTQTDRRLVVLSIAHGYARTCDLGTWLLSGCSLAITRGFDGWARHASRFLPTLVNSVPSLAGRILAEDLIPPSLRLIGCGGAAMTESQFLAWAERGVSVIQGYGLTEAGPVIASQTPDSSIAGSVGGVVEGWEHEVRKGRLFVRGEHLMSRYWNDDNATRRRIDNKGWLDTGDLVESDPATQQLRILGRADDRIVLANGHKVDPLGFEQRLQSLKEVRTAILMPADSGRHVELWYETENEGCPLEEIESVLESVPTWARPSRTTRFEIPAELRSRLFNRKGAIRRTELSAYLKSLPGS